MRFFFAGVMEKQISIFGIISLPVLRGARQLMIWSNRQGAIMAESGIMSGVAAPDVSRTLEERIQAVLDGYRPTLYMDGGDVHLLKVDEKGIAHVKMLGACIDCPVSVL